MAPLPHGSAVEVRINETSSWMEATVVGYSGQPPRYTVKYNLSNAVAISDPSHIRPRPRRLVHPCDPVEAFHSNGVVAAAVPNPDANAIVRQRPHSKWQSVDGKSPSSPIVPKSRDDEHGRDTEYSAAKRPRKEKQQRPAILTEDSESEMRIPLSVLFRSPTRKQSRHQHESVRNTEVNEEIRSVMVLSNGQLTTPVCGTSAHEARRGMPSIAKPRKHELPLSLGNYSAQLTPERPLVVQPLQRNKGLYFRTIKGTKQTIQELLGISNTVKIQFKVNNHFSTREIVRALIAPTECNTPSPLGKQKRGFDVMSRGIDNGSNTKVLNKSVEKKGFKESHSLHTSVDAASNVKQRSRKKLAIRPKRSSLEFKRQLERETEVASEELLAIVPLDAESISHGKRFCYLSADGLPETNIHSNQLVEEEPTVQQEGEKLGERPILLRLRNVGTPDCTIDNTVLRSSMDSHASFFRRTKNLPIWSQLEAMDVFQKVPQRPHFRLLNKLLPTLREGMAIALMVSYANTVERVRNLSIEEEDIITSVEENRILDILEENGFDVQFLRQSLRKLLQIKFDYIKYVGERGKLKEKILDKESVLSGINSFLNEKNAAIFQLEEMVGHRRWNSQNIAERLKEEKMQLSGLKEKARCAKEACSDAEHQFHSVLAEL